MWLFHKSELRKQELATGFKLRSAIEEARNWSRIEQLHALQLVNADPRWMSAVSPRARISWGELVCDEFSTHFHLGPDQPEPDQPIFLVTMCDRRCCTSHQEKNIDIPGFIQRLRQGLRGLSYLGMVEPALYSNVCEGARIHGKRLVSWHVHLLAWGESRSAIKTPIEMLNKQGILLPIADGLSLLTKNAFPRANWRARFATS